MKSDAELKAELGVKFLVKMMEERSEEPDYVMGFAHALMIMGAIDQDRFKGIREWAEDSQYD